MLGHSIRIIWIQNLVRHLYTHPTTEQQFKHKLKGLWWSMRQGFVWGRTYSVFYLPNQKCMVTWPKALPAPGCCSYTDKLQPNLNLQCPLKAWRSSGLQNHVTTKREAYYKILFMQVWCNIIVSTKKCNILKTAVKFWVVLSVFDRTW